MSDYYEYMENREIEGVNSLFKGEYMTQYAWSEFTLGMLMGDYL